MDRMSIAPMVESLERAFDHCNEVYFDGLIPRPVITLAEGAKIRARGWVTVAPVWAEIDGEQRAHELNISSDYLRRDFVDIVNTLMHEMVHLENIRNGVKDTARSGNRHNKKFADCAEQHGMEGYKGEDFDKAGWRARLKPETAEELIPALGFLAEALKIARDPAGDKIKKKSSVIKYTCPDCGASCRATKQIAIMCLDCEEQMHPEN